MSRAFVGSLHLCWNHTEGHEHVSHFCICPGAERWMLEWEVNAGRSQTSFPSVSIMYGYFIWLLINSRKTYHSAHLISILTIIILAFNIYWAPSSYKLIFIEPLIDATVLSSFHRYSNLNLITTLWSGYHYYCHFKCEYIVKWLSQGWAIRDWQSTVPSWIIHFQSPRSSLLCHTSTLSIYDMLGTAVSARTAHGHCCLCGMQSLMREMDT